MNTAKLRLSGTSRSLPEPPSHLSADSAEFWRSIVREYRIDDAAGLRLLERACTAMDRGAEARRAIKKHGVLVPDRSGGLKANPACAIERDAAGQFVAALKQMHLDLEPVRDGAGRPPGR
jgi:P27 family predicted phage terminase small subunit